MRTTAIPTAIILTAVCMDPAAADTVNIGVGNTYYDPAFVVVESGATFHWSRA